MFHKMLLTPSKWLVKWSDDYKTGEETIDSFHKAIMENGNELYDLFKSTGDIENCKKLTQETIKLILDHFNYEEKLFFDNNLIGCEEHVLQHGEMIKLIESIQTSKSFLIQCLLLNQMIIYYLEDHLVNSDKKMIAELKRVKGEL